MDLYIIKSVMDGTVCVGISKDASIRLTEHNKGKVRSTKHRKPWRLVYSEKLDNIQAAREREKFLKSYSGVKEKRKILSGIV